MSAKPIPEHLKGLKFHIDNRYSIVFDNGDKVSLVDNQSYYRKGTEKIENVRKWANAVIALLEAYDGQPFEANPTVTNWEIEDAVRNAKEASIKAMEAAERLEQVEKIYRVKGDKE